MSQLPASWLLVLEWATDLGLLDATGPVVDANLGLEWYYDLLSAETEAADFLTEGGSGVCVASLGAVHSTTHVVA